MSVFPCFLTDSFADYDDDNPDGRDMPEAGLVVDHIEHALGVAGVDGVGFGTDYDGINHTAKGFESIEKLPVLLGMLKARGYGEQEIAKMASYNLLRVISAQ